MCVYVYTHIHMGCVYTLFGEKYVYIHGCVYTVLSGFGNVYIRYFRRIIKSNHVWKHQK